MIKPEDFLSISPQCIPINTDKSPGGGQKLSYIQITFVDINCVVRHLGYDLMEVEFTPPTKSTNGYY